MGSEGKGGGPGRHAYRRDYQRPDRDGFMDRDNSGSMENGGASKNGSWGSYHSSARANAAEQTTTAGASGNGAANGNVAANGNGIANGSPQAALADIERRVASMQQDFSQSLHKVGEKENEKFDLIFAILTELQHRQAQLEESVRSLKAQFGGGQAMVGPAGPNMVSPQGNGCGFVASNFNGQQMNGGSQLINGCGPMNNGQMNGMAGTNQMQQFAGCTGGVMQADGQMFPMGQMIVVQSPVNGGMQYAMPQVMSPTGMQPIPQMMHFMGQGADMNGMNGMNGNGFGGGQDGCVGQQGQMQMPMTSNNGQGERHWEQHQGGSEVSKSANAGGCGGCRQGSDAGDSNSGSSRQRANGNRG